MASLALTVLAAAGAEPAVQLDCGAEVRGFRTAFDVQAFEGLRYAEPPVGPLRFARPRDRHGCEEDAALEAKESGSVCPQMAVA
jgi:carboxylesterase type B